jgi:hypothetical protein
MQALPKLNSRTWLALWLVAALLLRGLIPEGFMPVAGAGGLTMELCPGAGALPPGLSAHLQDHQTGHPGGHGQRGSGDAGHHASCLFSTGASTAFAALLAAPVVRVPAHTVRAEPSHTRLHVPAILRAQSSRGPPLPA